MVAETANSAAHGRDDDGFESNPSKEAEEGHGQANGQEDPAQSKTPKRIGFFHADLKATRGLAFKRWAITVLGLGVFILTVLSIYWGSLFRVYANLPNLIIWVVDFDATIAPYNETTTPIVGPFVTNYFNKLKPAEVDNLGWTIKSPADFNYDPTQVREGIYEEKAYAAIIVNANATALLQAAVANGNSSYDPTGAAQFIYNTARDDTTLGSYILPALLDVIFPLLSDFGAEWVSILSRNASSQNVFLTPTAVNPAIGFSLVDLRPFVPPAATPAISIGLIYLIIISFFSFSFLMPVHALFFAPSKDHAPVTKAHVLIWRIVSSITAYFFLSLCYSLVSLAFQIPFSNPPASHTSGALNANAYGKGSFVVYWMLNWVGMAALGLPSENMAMILGLPYASMWLIFWVITNVSTSFNAIDLESNFYRWGYAWPLFRIVQGSRTILFDTKSYIGLDFGILFAWVAISILFFPFASWVMQWKNQRAQRKK